MANNTLDLKDITLDMSGLIPALIAKPAFLNGVIKAVEGNVAFQDALAQAIWPSLQARMLQYIRANVSTGTGGKSSP